MRKLFFIPSACLLFIISCNPEKSVDTPRIRPEDPKALSSAIKVWHGIRNSGIPPAASTNPAAPVLDQQTNNQSIKAIASRYAIIQPEVISGSVAGYYLKVNGASDYFKVDYSKPRNVSGRFVKPVRASDHNRGLARGMNIDSIGGGTLDSSIVLVIPTTIQPGQFCITYYAYDSAGLVSNPIIACITVSSFGGDASVSFVPGTWHITGISDDTTAGWDPVFGVGDTIYNTGKCVNGHIVDTFGSGPGFIDYPAMLFIVTQADLTFSDNGALRYVYSESQKQFNYSASSCSNFVFDTQTDGDVINGAWSYTAATHKMILIFDFDDTGAVDPEAYEYTFTKVHNNKFYLYDPIDDSWLRLEK